MGNLLDAFVTGIIAVSDYEELDRVYLRNRILALVGQGALTAESQQENLIDLKDELVALAQKDGVIEEGLAAADMLGAELMNFITPTPSQVNRNFWQKHGFKPQLAIEEFYQLSQANDYIKLKAIANNIAYTTQTEYGDLEITINLSKPEKDPKEIAKAKLVETSHYPTCQLCMENEGYQGRLNYPARANHRIIRFDLSGEEWGFQYSPYAYFNEHCIFLDGKHEPMGITRASFERLLSILELFPGYFVGSNAGLPIVGGSILTHDHYQGGSYSFPMDRAQVEERFHFEGFPQVTAELVKWPMSVIRLRSADKEAVIDLADKIHKVWQSYSDPAVQILAETDGISHHTVTPIARMREGEFELDLVLRDNQTSEEFPDGIYHPHPDVQHIKKENIGLIEVMGLAILPPRLKQELAEVEDFLLGKREQVAAYHQAWAEDLKASHPDVTEDAVTDLVRQSVGKIFARVLEDAGVYKRSPEGQAAFRRFIASVGRED